MDKSFVLYGNKAYRKGLCFVKIIFLTVIISRSCLKFDCLVLDSRWILHAPGYYFETGVTAKIQNPARN